MIGYFLLTLSFQLHPHEHKHSNQGKRGDKTTKPITTLGNFRDKNNHSGGDRVLNQ
ncbi:TPA: hypothetical protein ON596_002165 [Citrobacter freundii]|uniref:Uncharacterized protein n=2 Tax=Citrobacter freundii complex TaxID=1344959 RepID=A0A7G2ITM9_CITFR|nr:hypothetical protein HMPREF1144_4648 [Klebsiella sp. OBRC7]CDL38794.1 hypothetical protein [Citrobacter freundii]BDA57786.1 hypothetical protein NUITMVR1_54450 [Raoultella ornithinolytica]BDN99241.1 hypothetical protein KAM621c_43460 [Citrobacter braakii]BDV21332.1 hypothetical protein [Escherichia coli]GKP81012.1 hypothetical protein NUKP48_27290 [Klebsiella quasipneumoniae]